MANKIYYGVSTTASATATKQVKLVDASFNVSSLQKGDILSVYFAYKNTATNVSLALYINDVQQETNTSNANGNLVYNTGRITVQSGAWTDGEVVNFSYTHNGTITENPDNVYYWEMIGKPVATGTTYGDVTLDGNVIEGDTITIKTFPIPSIPTKTSDLTNDSGFLTNPLQVTIDGQKKTIIDLHTSNQDTVINSIGGGILLRPAQQVIIGTTKDNRNLTVNGNITSLGGIITAPTIKASTALATNSIGSYTSGGTITFTSPVNITNGTVSSLKTNGITIGNQTLPNYIRSFLNTDDAKNILNSWLAEQLNGYLYTRRYHCGPYGSITAGNWKFIDLGGGSKHSYTYTQDNGVESAATTANLNIPGYDIVGIIAWETYGPDYCSYGNICSIYWNNNDPSTGFLKLRLAAVTKDIPRNGIKVSVDILYKKRLQ